MMMIMMRTTTMIQEIGRRISTVTEDARETTFLFQRLSRTTILHFDPRVTSFCCLFAVMSYIGVPLLFAVFSTF